MVKNRWKMKLGNWGEPGAAVRFCWGGIFFFGGKGNHFLNSNCGQHASSQILVSKKKIFPLKLLSSICPFHPALPGAKPRTSPWWAAPPPRSFYRSCGCHHPPPALPCEEASGCSRGMQLGGSICLIAGSYQEAHAVPHLSHILQTSPCQ